MARILIIESSARKDDSISRELTRQFIAQWQGANPDDSIQLRDLAAEPIPHLTSELLNGWMKSAEERSPAEQQAVAVSDELIAELMAADILVLAVPMYNFSIPSTLKAWLDHVLRAGVTFRYGATGPEGLLNGKRAIVLTARGGVYAGTGMDHQEPYLRQVLGFIGIGDLLFVNAEGMNMGGDTAAQGLQKAREKLAAIA